MSQPTRRKKSEPSLRARRDSARLFADGQSDSSHKGAAKAQSKGVPKKNTPVSISSLSSQDVLWTKPGAKRSSLPARILQGIGNFFRLVFSTLFTGIKTVFSFFASLISRSKIAAVIVILVLFLLAGGLLDYGLNWGKVYSGIKIGDIDVSGKSIEDVEKLIEDTYGPRLVGTTVYIFANEEASRDLEASLAQTNDAEYAEYHSPEEVQARKLVWEVDASKLGATLDTSGLVEEAISYGRENGGLINRLNALFSGHTINPRAHYAYDQVENIAADIDATIGVPRVNYDINVVEGRAVVVEGHDGDMVNRGNFVNELDNALLATTEQHASFVAQTEHAPLQINWEAAQVVCDQVNSAIVFGAQFVYNGIGWNASAVDLGDWLKTRIVEDKGAWILQPYLDYQLAKGTLFNHLKVSFSEADVKVRFSHDNGDISVSSDTQGLIPQSQQALDSLSALIFNEEAAPASQPVVTVESSTIPESMSLNDAVDAGIVGIVSEYTTEYASGVENRNFNIHRVSDLIDRSIIPADGGVWSFNDTTGYCNEEAGFKAAGVILDGEYVDDIGGGICQVATTVFNAVYNAGYPVVERHNHSLYTSNYPAGLDAAVSWPDLNLRWKNDTSSDILLVTNYSDSTVTVSLYGVNPGYQVSTYTADWEKGKKYTTKKIVDDTLSPGASYIETAGIDGSSIYVIRTVKDKSGTLLHEDRFSSIYEPRNEVVHVSPEGTNETKGNEEGSSSSE